MTHQSRQPGLCEAEIPADVDAAGGPVTKLPGPGFPTAVLLGQRGQPCVREASVALPAWLFFPPLFLFGDLVHLMVDITAPLLPHKTGQLVNVVLFL